MILPKCHFQHVYVRVTLLIVQIFDIYIKDGKAILTHCFNSRQDMHVMNARNIVVLLNETIVIKRISQS